MENTDPNTTSRVQHVAKSSSDQLLRKFAEVGSADSKDRSSSSAKDLRLAKRAKTSQQSIRKECDRSCSSVLAERKSLLLPSSSAQQKSTALIRKLGFCRAKIRAREIKNRSIITALEKTWRRTVEGASRVLMEKHYNRHKRLVNDS